MLEQSGPSRGRPLLDTITASRIPNMKELRPPSTRRSEIRILFDHDIRAITEQLAEIIGGVPVGPDELDPSLPQIRRKVDP